MGEFSLILLGRLGWFQSLILVQSYRCLPCEGFYNFVIYQIYPQAHPNDKWSNLDERIWKTNKFCCSSNIIPWIKWNINIHTIPLFFRKLKKSNISYIPETIFSHLYRLRSLSLAFNIIESLPVRVFYGPNLMEWLFINSNRLTRLPNIGHLTKLTWLNMSDNLLTLENEKFDRMDSLIEL